MTASSFTANRRLNAEALWILERTTVDLTVVPAADTTISIERGHAAAIRMIASTMPRKLD